MQKLRLLQQLVTQLALCLVLIRKPSKVLRTMMKPRPSLQALKRQMSTGRQCACKPCRQVFGMSQLLVSLLEPRLSPARRS
jgi:hypothetical protein